MNWLKKAFLFEERSYGWGIQLLVLVGLIILVDLIAISLMGTNKSATFNEVKVRSEDTGQPKE